MRQYVKNFVASIPDTRVAIFVDGNVKSAALAFAAHSVGMRVKLYASSVLGKTSADRAIQIATTFDWDIDHAIVPRERDALKTLYGFVGEEHVLAVDAPETHAALASASSKVYHDPTIVREARDEELVEAFREYFDHLNSGNR